jgi:hypothetical protein
LFLLALKDYLLHDGSASPRICSWMAMHFAREKCANCEYTALPHKTFRRSKLELRPNLVGPTLPFPLLPTASLNALVHSPQLQREPWTQFLQPSLDVFHTFDGFAIGIEDALLRCTFVSEYVAMTTEEDKIALIVKCNYLPALEFRARGEHCIEELP